MKLDLTGVKGVIASILIVLSLFIGVLNAVQGALPPTVEKLGVTNFDTLQTGDGSVSEPAFGFTSDTDTGMYRIGANNVGLAVGGSKILDVDSGGLTATTITVTNLISQSLGFDATGNITATGDASIGSATIGGGYSDTGCTITTAGVLNCAGAMNIDGAATITGALSSGALTAASASIGGGYSSTGCDITAAGVLNCAGAMNIDGATTITGAVTLGAGIVYSNSGAIPTDGGIVTPTADIWSLTPGAAVTVTLAACTTGQKTVLYNTANFSIIVSDTGNGVLAGAQTLGQYDALALACIGTKWVQVSAVSQN